jgi:hypothetical protein
MIECGTDLPLPALLFDRDFRIYSPKVPLALFVTFHESIMLAQIMTHARLPATCGSLEFVPGVLPLNESVD